MLTKESLAKKLREPGLSYRDAVVYIDALVEVIVDALSRGESIQVRGLGSFDFKTVPEKNYPSLRTGPKAVPAHGRIVFRPGDRLRKAAWDCGNVSHGNRK